MKSLHRRLLRDVHILFDVGAVGDRTDRELLKWFTSSDGETAQLAFMALVGRHGPMVLRVCQSILRDTHAADDAFQAVFIVLAHKSRRLWVQDSLAPWLHRVACNVASCARSAAALRRRHERSYAELTAISVEERQWDDLCPTLHEELDRLPERYRVPIVLCYIEGLTHERAAQRLEWPVGTVRTRLFRGRELLRTRLVRRGLAPAAGGLAVALGQETASAAVPEVLAQSAIVAATCETAAGAIPEAVAILAKGALLAMAPSRLRLFASSAFAVAVVACGVPVVLALSQRGAPLQTPPVQAASSAESLQTPNPAAVKEPMVAAHFADPDRKRHVFSGYFPNPYQVNGLLNSSPPGSLTIHLGPVRFEDQRLLQKAHLMTLIERETVIATTSSARDRISAHSTKRGGWQTYRVPTGVKFKPDASDNAVALYLAGESIPEVAVFSIPFGVWNKQVLKVPAKGKLDPFMTPEIVMYGTGRWVYAYSALTNTWDALEVPGDAQVRARLSGNSNVLVEDVDRHRLSIFAPGIGRWDTIDVTAGRD